MEAEKSIRIEDQDNGFQKEWFQQIHPFESQAIHKITRIFMEFSFANMQDLFISRELSFATLGFSLQNCW